VGQYGARAGARDPAEPPAERLLSRTNYQLSKNPHFSLDVKESPDGNKYPELILENHLDRENQSSHHLILTAVDGGNPVRSGTVQIRISVTDANDNPPVFTEEIYKVSLRENLPKGSLVMQVKATDKDDGLNAQITYSFRNTPDDVRKIYNLDSENGRITNVRNLDFEDTHKYMLVVEARDGGGQTAQCKVQIAILDENDNAPEMKFTSVFSPIPEDSPPGTVIALIKVHDEDTRENGEVECQIEHNLPFKTAASSN
uniref:Cadherin domain-containing protein n=1 Tax=Pelusios castaneus TaxID=367368 RepID=A0A8C8VFZ2_9SAUR